MTHPEQENAALRQENKDLRKKNENQNKYIEELNEQLTRVKGYLDEVCADRDAERTNAEIWREKYEKLSGEMEQWQDECHADESKDLARIEKLQEYAKEWEEVAHRQEEYAASWRKEAQKREEQLKAAEEQRKEAETALQRMKGAADIAQSREASVKADLEAVERERKRLANENGELHCEINHLLYREKQLQAALAEICIRAFCGGDKCE